MLKKSTTRVQIELAEQSYQRLNALKEKTESTSYTEVIKNALRLYEDFIEQYEQGKRFYFEDVEGKIIEYKVFV